MAKTFLQIFEKYKPNERFEKILDGAQNIKIQADKVNRMLNASVDFSTLVAKDDLYEIEAGIAKAYELNLMKIMPHYPRELFDESYISELMKETEKIGIVARGFFSKYRYKFDDMTLTVEIPFSKDGVALLHDARTPAVMQGIILSEFGINIKVNIIHTNDDEFLASNNSLEAMLEEYDKRMAVQAQSFAARVSAPQPAQNEPEMLPRKMTLNEENAHANVEDGICTVGIAKFDISEPEYVIGDPFVISPISIAQIDSPQRNIVIVGTVFDYVQEPTRSGEKMSISFSVTDQTSSIEVKCFVPIDEAGDISSNIKNGSVIAMKGYVKKELRRDKTEGTDFQFFFNNIAKIKRIGRMDNAPVKRVELHLHTNMSHMDALIPPDVAVKQAKAWGHPAVAITDHGTAQGYQEAMLASEKIGQKVIYGVEAYFVNDTAGAIYGAYNEDFDAETIVFDIETTGLSVKNCKITEIGAVKIRDGEIIDTFNTFVNPEVPIPAEIVELTSITDEMVADAPKIKEALNSFFEFIGGGRKLLVAHNANFDTGFIRYAAEECGMEFTNPYLDTVALSRYINPTLKKHTASAPRRSISVSATIRPVVPVHIRRCDSSFSQFQATHSARSCFIASCATSAIVNLFSIKFIFFVSKGMFYKLVN